MDHEICYALGKGRYDLLQFAIDVMTVVSLHRGMGGRLLLQLEKKCTSTIAKFHWTDHAVDALKKATGLIASSCCTLTILIINKSSILVNFCYHFLIISQEQCVYQRSA